MAVPKSHQFPIVYYVDQYANGKLQFHTEHNSIDSDVVSSASPNAHTPFVYRGPTIIVDGELMVDGEVYGNVSRSSQPSFKSFKSMRGNKSKSYSDYLLYARNMWRNPTAYNAYLVEGMVGSIPATLVDTSKSTGEVEHSVYGDCTFGALETYMTATVPLSLDSGLENRAVIKVLGQLKGQQVNLSNAFGERLQTVELVAGTLSRLTNAVRSLRRGDLGGVARSLGIRGAKKAPRGRNFHEKWLEYQYGWKPLYADVHGAVSALHAKDQEDPKRYMFTAKASVKQPYVSRVVSRGLTGYRDTVQGTQGCFIRLDYYVDNPLTSSLSQLGITNPLETIWEVTPFSFIWDWFNPIGQYLTSIDASAGKTLRGGTITNWSKSQRTVGLFGGSYQDTIRSVSGGGNATTLNMDRRVLSSFPIAHVPGFKNPFPGPRSPQHLQNLIALFASSAKGRRVARS